jgi:hypothetical protein
MFCFICGKKNYVTPSPILSHNKKEPELIHEITNIDDKFVNVTINDNNIDGMVGHGFFPIFLINLGLIVGKAIVTLLMTIPFT